MPQPKPGGTASDAAANTPALRVTDERTGEEYRLEITDSVRTLFWLFLGGDALASPGPEICGADPTEDTLSACQYEPATCASE